MSAAGLAASLATSIIGGSSARRQQEAQEQALRAKEAADNARYLYQKNVSEADTARGRRVIDIANRAADKLWKRAEGAAAVGGGTDAATAMAKEQGNQMISDAVSQVTAGDTARQDRAEEAKAQADAQNTASQMQIAQQKAQNTAAMTAGISDAFAQGAALAESAKAPSAPTTPNTPAIPTAQDQYKGFVNRTNAIVNDAAKRLSTSLGYKFTANYSNLFKK